MLIRLKVTLFLNIIVNLFSSEAKLDIDIGSIYDCSITYQEGIFGFPQHQDCDQRGSELKLIQSNVWQYHPRQRSISVFVCSARMFTLKCGEHWFGDDHESSQTSDIFVSKWECQQAYQNTKKTNSQFKSVKVGHYRSVAEPSYECHWMDTITTRTKVFDIVQIEAFQYSNDAILHQDYTKTRCLVKTGNCRPKENPLSVLIWKNQKVLSSFKNLGQFTINLIHGLVLFPELVIRSAIQKQKRKFNYP